MTVITRFAPSPTGKLHVGNARTAIICYLYAKSQGGKFMLRMDDTDYERSTEEFADGIQRDLKWLGIDWEIFSKQSDRKARYDEVIEKLIKDGRLYPCYETPEEIEIKRKMLLNRGLPPIYDRAALKLTDEEKQKFEDEGRSKHWRFKLDESQKIEWEDQVKGLTRFDAKHLTDPVLIRANGSPTYMLPSAIDDIDFDITHVVRGEDHVSNTAIQIQLFEAIGGKVPQFAHTSLIKSKDGKISKRIGGFEIEELKAMGIEAIAINSLMARLGTSKPIEAETTLEEIITNFSIKNFSTSSAIYDVKELERINQKVIHKLSYKDIRNRDDLKGIDEEFWNVARANINTVKEVKDWWQICKEEINPIIEESDQEFIKHAASLLPEGKLNEESWSIWINKIKEATGRKGKELFMPIRKALTALENGPELKYILPLIGRDVVVKRLAGK